jgi:hypothetical protein
MKLINMLTFQDLHFIYIYIYIYDDVSEYPGDASYVRISTFPSRSTVTRL